MRALNFIKAHNAILLLLLLPTFCLFGMRKDNEVRLKVNQLNLRIKDYAMIKIKNYLSICQRENYGMTSGLEKLSMAEEV